VLVLATACVPARPSQALRPNPGGAAYEWRLPPGSPVPLVPHDNPMSQAKVDLGRRLFYDMRLSGNETYACASCHQQARGFTDGRAHAIGSTGAQHPRSAMSLANVAYNATFGWAGTTNRTLEAQMAVPMNNEHPVELGLKGRDAEVVARFTAAPDDVVRFQRAFPADPVPVTIPNIVKAVASFERTLVSGTSPLDRYLYRDEHDALSASAVRGMTLFFSATLHCSECHTGFNLSGATTFVDGDRPDVVFHNTGLYNVDGKGAYPSADQGLIAQTRKRKDMGRFRAPTLRNIAVTAPYMHDGSVATLSEAIDHYAAGGRTIASGPHQGAGRDNANKDAALRGFTLTPEQKSDLVAFLESLTDDALLHDGRFANPWLQSTQ
jgi:cytochrome c peroxidase